MTPPCQQSEHVRCPVCHQTSFSSWGRKDAFDIQQCRHCSHVFADMTPVRVDYSDAAQFRTYITNGLMDSDEAYYRHLCASETAGSHTATTAELIIAEAKRLGIGRASNWLDVGCGSGFLVSQLREKLAIDAVGIEPGGWGQIAAREKRIPVVHGLLAPETFPAKFQNISATDVLEHQPDPHEMLRLFQSNLANQGRVFLSFPLGDSLRARVAKAKWAMIAPPTHCNFFTRRSFAFFIKQTGFRLERFVQYNTSDLLRLTRFGVPATLVNRIANRLRLGDQAMVILRFDLKIS